MGQLVAGRGRGNPRLNREAPPSPLPPPLQLAGKWVLPAGALLSRKKESLVGDWGKIPARLREAAGEALGAERNGVRELLIGEVPHCGAWRALSWPLG